MTTTLNGTRTPVTRRPTTSAAETPLNRDWRDSANCATADREVFFPTGNAATIRAQEKAALTVCGNCTVRAQCLAWAVSTGQYTGVWGGLTEKERRDLYVKRERGVTRCLNEQTWIEAEMADGRTQKAIAKELGVDHGVLNRAVQQMRAEREQLAADDVETAA